MPGLDVGAALKAGIAHQQAGRWPEAEALYRQILAESPRHPDALHLLGLIAHQTGHPDAAAQLMGEALREAPGLASIHSNLGNVRLAQGRVEEALACFGRALELEPDFPEAHNNRGNALKLAGRMDEAAAAYARAVALRPGFAEAHSNLGMCLQDQGQTDAAVACLERALALRPDLAEAHTNLGLALESRGLPDQAMASHRRALALQPDYPEAHNNLGNALKLAGRFGEAVDCYARALALRPGYAEAENNLGLALAAQGRVEESLAAFQRALALRPDFAQARWNLGLTLLLQGDYAGGWPLYESRWQAIGPRARLPDLREPLWTGEQPLAGRTILLHHEQGLGDTLMTLRYVPLLAERGARVVLQMPPTLAELAAAVPGASQVVVEGGPLPPVDLQCPMMSLPLAFHTTLPDVPARVPYLFAPEARQADWQERLGPRRRPRVGLVWAGSRSQAFDQRPVPLPKLLPLLSRAAEFISLQQAHEPDDARLLQADGRLRDCSACLGTLADTAGLIMQLDVVITIDTAVAHLAGGLGKPVWLLLGYAADYRWLLGRDDSPWYPTLRLFRQPAFGEWDPVLARLGITLDELLEREG